VRAYDVKDIPGVIKAGAKWTFHWQQAGNNGDGIVGLPDGSLLLAQNDSSAVLRLMPDDKTTVAYPNTRTGGAVSISAKGKTFIVERGLHQRIEQLTPIRRVHADMYNGEPLDCLGGVINDLVADSQGGVYFTMGGLFYADKDGKITRYGENLTTNGVTLSPDEKTLYVTNGGRSQRSRAEGRLADQREFVKLGGRGDGSTIDGLGRVCHERRLPK
jgi:sugar lactone lactonase YvrE